MAFKESLQFLAYDSRLAARSLARSPGFVIAAVLSLGLSIGAGTVGYSVIDAIRFRSLPFPNPDRLVTISEVTDGACPGTCDVHWKTFALLREHKFSSINAIAGFNTSSGASKSFGSGEDQYDVRTGIVSGALFPLIGATPAMGRIFSPEEDRIGAVGTMLIGHELWQNYFGADPAILGKAYVLSGETFAVIGVMQPGFRFEGDAQTWLAASRYLDPTTGTSLRSTNVLARLAPGATIAQLRSELTSLEPAINEIRDDRRSPGPFTFSVAPLRERYVNAAKSSDLIFAGIVGAILLIGCTNVAGLVLVRAMRQRRELALRTALGAGRVRLARFLFVQNMQLATSGLVVGLLLAGVSLGALRSAALLQTLRVPGMEYRFDLRVAVFAIVLTIVIAALLSLAPLRLLGEERLQQTLRESAVNTTSSRGGNRTQQMFVVVQTACAVALLVGTGLMVKTVLRFSGVQLGYDADRVLQLFTFPTHQGRVKEKYMPVAQRLLLELPTIPGVDAAAVKARVPLGVARPGEQLTVTIDGERSLTPEMMPNGAQGISPDYFKVMGISLVSGRTFEERDSEGSPAVAIINEWAARHWWPGENPIGRSFAVDTATGKRAIITVVGVVRDNLANTFTVLLAKPGAEVYRPFAQASFWATTWYVRANRPTGNIAGEMQKAVMRQVPNGRPSVNVVASQIESQHESVRANAMQIAAFAIVGVLLAITGLYGVLSYIVQQRTQEVGIRGVLGARQSQILRMMLGQAMRLAAFGVVVGLVAAGAAMRILGSMLYGTPVADPVVYASVAALFLLVALAASYVPAWRATQIDPASAIRSN